MAARSKPANSADTKKRIDAIREATGAADEEIKLMLKECNYDPNETTARLIDSAWHRGIGCIKGAGCCLLGPTAQAIDALPPPSCVADPFCEVQSKKAKLKKKVGCSQSACWLLGISFVAPANTRIAWPHPRRRRTGRRMAARWWRPGGRRRAPAAAAAESVSGAASGAQVS